MTVMTNDKQVPVPRDVLIVLLLATVVAGALIAGVGAVILNRAGVSVPLSRAIAFPVIGLLIYPVLKLRASMRGSALPVRFWTWALVWTALAFFSYLFVAPAIERMLE